MFGFRQNEAWKSKLVFNTQNLIVLRVNANKLLNASICLTMENYCEL
jgi:hypothetical protein